METFFAQVEWMPTIISFLLAFGLGWLWYSDKWFGVKWRAGKGGAVWNAPMWMPMLTQAVSTLLLAMVINAYVVAGECGMAILLTIIIAGFVKANGLYAGKTKYAIGVEVGYILVMAAIMILVSKLL